MDVGREEFIYGYLCNAKVKSVLDMSLGVRCSNFPQLSTDKKSWQNGFHDWRKQWPELLSFYAKPVNH